jgi:hypothetical protein
MSEQYGSMDTNLCLCVHGPVNDVQSDLSFTIFQQGDFLWYPTHFQTNLHLNDLCPKWKINLSDVFMTESWNVGKQYKSSDKMR